MKNGKNIFSILSQIKSDYQVLHFDEFPILFCGRNEAGEQVIGSFIQENEDEKCLEFFHAIVASKDFQAFSNRQLSYLDLLKKARRIFFVQKDLRQPNHQFH